MPVNPLNKRDKRRIGKAHDDRDCTHRQELWCQYYVAGNNGTQAAILAGYSPGGASSGSAENKKSPYVIRRLAELSAERLAAIKINQNTVIKALASIAFADFRKLYGPDGVLLPPDQWPDDVASAVSGIDVTETPIRDTDEVRTQTKIRSNDRLKALEILAKHLGMLRERVIIEGGDRPIVVEHTDLASRLALLTPPNDGELQRVEPSPAVIEEIEASP